MLTSKLPIDKPEKRGYNKRMLALLKLLARVAGIELVTIHSNKVVYIDDDVHGRVLTHREAADIIVA